MSDQLKSGRVIFFSKKLGYGFIAVDGEKDLFVHWSAIKSEGFKMLQKDQKVKFEVSTNKRGQPVAVNVEIDKD